MLCIGVCEWVNRVCRRCAGEGVTLESTATLIRALAYCDKECNVQSEILRGIIWGNGANYY